MTKFRYWLIALALWAALSPLSAQIQVDIKFKRSLYVVYEPIICTVTITNQSGRTLELADTPRNQWFSFQIETGKGRPIPPNDPNYQNQPLTVPAGEKVVRAINLTPLFPLGEFGTYRVRGTVYSEELKQYFSSPNLNIEITEGRLLWEDTVGVPEGAGPGKTRRVSVLAHRLPTTSMLYLRVEDAEAGIVYCTTQLGRFIAFNNSDIEMDGANNIHILQNTAPKAFLYSQFDVNGKLVNQQGYQAGAQRPILVRSQGVVSVSGGTEYDPRATPPEKQLPKLGDRPVPLPTPQSAPTPEDKRPENLLSR